MTAEKLQQVIREILDEPCHRRIPMAITDEELLARIKRYRALYFASSARQMRAHRDYERARAEPDFDEEKWEEAQDHRTWEEAMKEHAEASLAHEALTADPPEDFAQLCKEMQEEFGE